MGRIDVILEDELELEFRKCVAERVGYKKGSLKRAIGEAVKLWLIMDKNEVEERLKHAQI